MAAIYPSTSPWAVTGTVQNQYLDILSIRPVPAEDDDILYTVQPQYAFRPDLLAYDLYGSHHLWWVFAQRNMDTIKDPINDLVPGVKIFLPKGPSLASLLGV